MQRRAPMPFCTDAHAYRSWNRLSVGGGGNWQSASQATVDGPNGPAARGPGLGAPAQRDGALCVQCAGVAAAQREHLLDHKYFVLDEYSSLYYAAGRHATLSFSYRF